MPQFLIDLNEEWERQLKEKAETESRSQEEVVLEAIRRYLQPIEADVNASATDPYEPLRRMIGLVREGPSDASAHHDRRAEDEG